VLSSDPVFLCLSTSEPAGEGEIVRLLAERGDSRSEVRVLERLARPAGRLTLAQARLAGVSNKELDAAPALDETLEDLLGFSEGSGAWIVPEGAAGRAALRRAAAASGFALRARLRVRGRRRGRTGRGGASDALPAGRGGTGGTLRFGKKWTPALTIPLIHAWIELLLRKAFTRKNPAWQQHTIQRRASRKEAAYADHHIAHKMLPPLRKEQRK